MGDWTGILSITAEQKQGKTIASDLYFQGALKVTRPFHMDDSGAACFYIMNPGGGYVGGDRYKMDVDLDEGANLLLTGQSATKIYKTVNRPAMQQLNFHLKAGSCLEYIADPIIAYEEAQYIQKTVVHMEQGAAILFTEILTPGWSPQGEGFKYHLLQLKTEIYMNDDLVLFDHLRLKPEDQNLNGLGILEGYTHFGSMIVIVEQITPDFVDKLYDIIHVNEHRCKLGLSMLAVSGFALRILAFSTQEIEESFEHCRNLIQKELFGKESIPLRKY